MTTYQGRLKNRQDRDFSILALTLIFAIVTIIALGMAGYSQSVQLQNTEVGLLACTEFLSDLEAAESF